jgi:hypothetical protein
VERRALAQSRKSSCGLVARKFRHESNNTIQAANGVCSRSA